MYAIIVTGGKQYKVENGDVIYIEKLDAEDNAEVTFDKVLAVGADDGIKVGAPYVEGASVTAKVLEHVKGNKVIVFKKIKRKGFDKKNGHRQCLTKIEIESIA